MTIIDSVRRELWTQSYTRYSGGHKQCSSIRFKNWLKHLIILICSPFNIILHTICPPFCPTIMITPNPSNLRKTAKYQISQTSKIVINIYVNVNMNQMNNKHLLGSSATSVNPVSLLDHQGTDKMLT